MGNMGDVKRAEVADLIGMREWRDELLIMVKVRDDIARTLKAINDQPGFLDSAADEMINRLGGRWKSISAAFSLLWENIGDGLSFAFRGAVTALLDIGSKFKGFAAGLKSVASTVATVLGGIGKTMGIDTSSAEGMGELIAKILGFSVALHFARPGFALMGFISDGLVAISHALLGVWAAVKVFGPLLGVGAATGAGGLALGALRFTFVAGALAVAIMNWDRITEAKKAVGDHWDFVTKGPQDPEWQKKIDDAKAQQKGPFEVLGRVLRELFGINSAKAGELPEHMKGKGAARAIERSAEKMSESVNQFGAKFQNASFSVGASTMARAIGGGGGGSYAGSSYSGGGATIGNGAVNTFGLNRRGILGGTGIAGVPGSFGGPTFGQKAPGIMAQLQRDFGLTKEQAAGVLGNLGHESGGLTQMQERNPRGGGRGGLGWAQWTGPRRKAFEAWAAQNGLNTSSDQANYGFLKHELNTTHSGALNALRKQSTVSGSMMAFERLYEGAGIKHYDSRARYANQAYALANGGGGTSAAGGLAAGLIPVKTAAGTVMMDPRNGTGQAFGGGTTSPAVLAAAQSFTKGGLAGGVDRFTAFNDHFHAGTGSKHASGLAGDLTIKDASKSAEAAEQMRQQFRSAGLTEAMFKVIDEYKSPSGRSTGGHLHYQFNSQEAAERYAQFKAQQAQAIAAQQPNAAGIASGVPLGGTGGALGRNQSAVSTVNSPNITINGYNKSPEELTNEMSRRMTESMNWRTHDVETELT
jgi:hypothetical protein